MLCGPNGSGKSTVLDALWFLRTLFERGHESALAAVGGQYFRKLDAPEDEPVEFTLTVGDIVWKLRFPMSIAGLRGWSAGWRSCIAAASSCCAPECSTRAGIYRDGAPRPGRGALLRPRALGPR